MGISERINIFGTNVSVLNNHNAAETVQKLLNLNSGYICFPDAFVIVSATKNKKLQNILNNSLITFPDGQPLVIYAKKRGIKNMTAVSGYWLLKELLKKDVTHFFYGSDKENLEKIKWNIEKEFPASKVVGYISPPFVRLEEIENNETIRKDIELINKQKPDIVWIGLNSPKQDYLMSHFYKYLDNSVMIGVGGVFDYLSGRLKISPEWIKKLSLRWAYRIVQNPNRYFKRNMFSIYHFVRLYIKEITKKK